MDLTRAITQAEHRSAAYVVGPADGSYLYKGSARDLHERLADHHAGRVSRTKNRRPLALLFHRYFAGYGEARQFEAYLKTGVGREWLRDHCSNRGPTVPPEADPP